MKTLLISSVILILTITKSYSGELQDFEKDATLKRGGGSNETERDTKNKCGTIWALLSDCGNVNYEEDEEAVRYLSQSNDIDSDSQEDNIFFRIDARYQTTKTDISGIGFHLEVAKNNYGFLTQYTKYDEITPSDELSFTQFHGLFKASTKNNLNLAIGIGVGMLQGEHNTSGISFYLPVHYRFNNIFSAEASSSLTSLNNNAIIDSKLSIKFNYKNISLLLSYLSFISPEENISGPSIGVSYQTN